MISERQVARGFQDLWREVLPLLTPHFVHLFNEAYREELCDDDGQTGSAVPSGDDTDPTLVAELAFHIARLAHERAMPLGVAAKEEVLLADATRTALSLIREYERRTAKSPASLTSRERSEALLLLRNYERFLALHEGLDVEFRPPLRGAGFVDACRADLSISDSLFEIKTVNRNIAGKDIRQLLVYLALQNATGHRRWSKAGFFNPRRGCIYHFPLDKVIPLMSGGRLTSEVFEQMVDYFCARDIQLDSRF